MVVNIKRTVGDRQRTKTQQAMFQKIVGGGDKGASAFRDINFLTKELALA